jgi:hypothetical protein
MKKAVLVTVSFSATFILLFYITILAVAFKQPQQQKQEGRKTLRKVGEEHDVEITSDIESEAEYSSMQSLVKDANAIVLGRIIETNSSFEDDDHIITTYQLEVKRVLKEIDLNVGSEATLYTPAPLSTPLKLVRAGGVVNVNGHRVSVKLQGHELLNEGKDYIFFLWWSPNLKAYKLAGGISGVILVENDVCKPLASKETITLKYGGMDLTAFIRDVLHN